MSFFAWHLFYYSDFLDTVKMQTQMFGHYYYNYYFCFVSRISNSSREKKNFKRLFWRGIYLKYCDSKRMMKWQLDDMLISLTPTRKYARACVCTGVYVRTCERVCARVCVLVCLCVLVRECVRVCCCIVCVCVFLWEGVCVYAVALCVWVFCECVCMCLFIKVRERVSDCEMKGERLYFSHTLTTIF